MMSLPTYLGSAFLINLRERTDRLELAKAELSRVGWELGPSGVNLYSAKKFADRNGFPSAGVRGAFHSHFECLKLASAAGSCGALILEDDIAFSPAVATQASNIIAELQHRKWDFVYFGHENTGPISVGFNDHSKSELQFHPWSGNIEGLHFYAVNGSIIHELLAHLDRVTKGAEGDQQFGPMPVDGAFNVFRRLNPHVKTLIASPKLGWQRPSRSDISPRRIDKVRALRPITTAFRYLKYLGQIRKRN
jgi:hypothetical protein